MIRTLLNSLLYFPSRAIAETPGQRSISATALGVIFTPRQPREASSKTA